MDQASPDDGGGAVLILFFFFFLIVVFLSTTTVLLRSGKLNNLISNISSNNPVLGNLLSNVAGQRGPLGGRSEEHTSELQSHHDLVCRLPLEKKKNPQRPKPQT